MTRPREVLRSDEGSILPLVIFFAALVLLLVLVVTAATSLYLERKRLLTLADGAALVGVEAFDLTAVEVTGASPRPVLDDASVSAAVGDYLDAHPATGFEQLRVDAATTPDGRSATVQLSSTWRPPVVAMLVPDGIRIDATATARSVFG